jgi:hypothetical protein
MKKFWGRGIHVFAYIIIALVFLGWEYFEAFVGAKIETVLAIFVTLVSLSTIIIQEKISTLSETVEAARNAFLEKSNVQVHELNTAIQLIRERRPRVGILRAYAITAGHMAPILSGAKISAEHCKFLIYNPLADNNPDRSNPKILRQLKRTAEACRGNISILSMLRGSNKITNLEIRRYNFFPTEYYIIADDQLLVSGNLETDLDDFSRVRPQDATVVFGDTASLKRIIELKIQTFDALFDACEAEFGPNHEVGLG